jgi:hypothetical protein
MTAKETTMSKPQNDPRNAIAVSGDDDIGDGGTGWVGGCAATLLVVILPALVLVLKAVLA